MTTVATLVLLFGAVPNPGVANDYAETPPAKIFFRYMHGGKPPMRFYGVNLVIQNRHESATWFLIRYWGDRPLPTKDEFISPSDPQPPFQGQEYVADGKRVVLVRHFGNDRFIAFQLRAKTQIEFEAFEIEAWKPIEEFEIWEVSSMRVNGETALEKWLPYNTLSDDKAKIPRRKDWNNLGWDFKRSRKRDDYRTEAVKSVVNSVIRRWTIPIAVEDAP